ncbi:hypothetical protein WHX55_15715 [Pseudomonas fluorescens]|uniref:hypothetical protein n=1 Tax=Pseudomonas fluorescens TaxID=294 RepID=UPI00324B07D6
MQELHLKQQQSELLAFIFALCSDNPDERSIAELGAFELMQELDESVLNLAIECYASLKTHTEAYTKGGH